MARFKVFRDVDANLPGQAFDKAQELPGRDWQLVSDTVLGDVAGLDNAIRRHGEDVSFEED